MYTKEYDPLREEWDILDPEGYWIASVNSETTADALLTHLNRRIT